jgi:hypothetical protein
MSAVRQIFQYFPNRHGTARLSPVGTLERSGGDLTFNFDVYPISNPDDPSKIVVLPQAEKIGVGQRDEADKDKKERPVDVRTMYLHFIARPGSDGLVRLGCIELYADAHCIIKLDALPSRAPDSAQANGFRIIAPAGGGQETARAVAAANMAAASGSQAVTDEHVALARFIR